MFCEVKYNSRTSSGEIGLPKYILGNFPVYVDVQTQIDTI